MGRINRAWIERRRNSAGWDALSFVPQPNLPFDRSHQYRLFVFMAFCLSQ